MSLKNLLGIEYPIFQGAMARIATAALAGPVSEAGGLGIIGSGGLTAAAVGFGTVVTAAAGFEIISQYILSIPGNPLISLSIATALMSIITGSSSGKSAIIVPAFAQNYIDMGIHPEVIHRVVAIASAAFTAMPHSGIVLTFFAVCKLNHKNAMKYMFVIMTGSNVAALVAVLFSAIVLNLK